ncbi:substrate-binding domain-containing protein [Microbacterium sp. ET2]|uniref:substrate-binding domain-containing protein n=1 Tax=Microbacterium albipurpureum TaxID=3050384 RepID=UPI00259D2E4D|nr:substrate-binding domain-containing protein [Microbacterium sp. ET2 (Ac-2212)]WJL96541.1 substrate-binding domain-containing protein [Microbacterium sp. ET2 (Ac-2212)]
MTTISKVLNGAADVSTDTRKRVEEHLRARGYRRRRSHRRSEYIEIVLQDFEGEWVLAVIEGVREAAAEVGLAISLSMSGDPREPDEKWVGSVLRRAPAGLILLLSSIAADAQRRLRTAGIPFVLVDPAGDPAPGMPSVGVSNWAGGVEATRHLIDLGHRRIAVIAGSSRMMRSLARVDGYRSAMLAAGLHLDDSLVRFDDDDSLGGEHSARLLLESAEPPTAIFAANDLQALGALRAAALLGVDVPEDLSIIGFDDLTAAANARPNLTTIHQPVREMAEEATRLVLRLADGHPPEVTRSELATTLVVRATTAPPSRRPSAFAHGERRGT